MTASATLCNLGNLSYMLGRRLVWDGRKEEVVGDPQVNRMLGKPQRYPLSAHKSDLGPARGIGR